MEQRVHPTGRRRHAGDHGFTLIEILIAIVLVGILSAVAVLGIGGLLGKAKASACAAERDSLSTAVTAYLTVNDTDTIPSDPGSGLTPMDTIRLAGLINENSKMYAIEPDGTLTPIENNPNHCGAVPTNDTTPGTDQSGTSPAGTNPSGTDPSGAEQTGPYLNPPGHFSAIAGNSMATFTWTAATTNGAFGSVDYYGISYTDDTGGDYHDEGCRVNIPAPLTCTVTGLQNGTKYRFAIWVWTDGGSGTHDPTDSLFVTPDATNPVVAKGTYLSSPLNLVAVTGDRTTTLTWDPPSSDGGYPITSYTAFDVNGNATQCDVAPSDALTCTFTDLQDDQPYNFNVRVTNQETFTAEGDPVPVIFHTAPPPTDPPATDPPATDPAPTDPATTEPTGTEAPEPPDTAPSGTQPARYINAPTVFRATAHNGTATFTWNAATTAGYGGLGAYDVSYTDDTGGDFNDNACLLGGTAERTCTVDGLTNGVKYRFLISVYTGSGVKGWGPSLFVTTDAVHPTVEKGTTLTAPTNVRAVVGDGTATLTWDAPSSDGGYPITGYTILDDSGNPYPSCTVLPTEPLTCTQTDLQNDATYDFTVQVTNQEGAQATSDPIPGGVTPTAGP